MIQRPLSLLFIALFSLAAQAHTARECETSMTAPPTIPRTAMPIYSIEVDEAGEVYRFGDRIPDLPSGRYLFLISDKRELILAPKYDADSYIRNGRGLATHKSLLARYKHRMGSELDGHVVAAGELIMAFGQLAYVGNRSGNFRSDETHLRYAVASLKDFGFIFTPKTEIVAFDPAAPQSFGHTDEDRDLDRFQLKVLRAVRLHPQGPALLRLYEELGRLFIEISPGQSVFDGGGMMIELAIRNRRKTAIMEFTYPFATVTKVDGLHFAIWKIWQRMKDGEDPAPVYFNLSAPYHIATVLQSKGDSLTSAQIRELQRISADFSALDPALAR